MADSLLNPGRPQTEFHWQGGASSSVTGDGDAIYPVAHFDFVFIISFVLHSTPSVYCWVL